MNFAGPSTSSIQILGTVNANGGDVFVIAKDITTSGSINASSGMVGLAAGNDILLSTDASGRIFVRQNTTLDPAAIVTTSGLINAARSTLESNGNIYAQAINISGFDYAVTGITTDSGNTKLVATDQIYDLGGTVIGSTANPVTTTTTTPAPAPVNYDSDYYDDTYTYDSSNYDYDSSDYYYNNYGSYDVVYSPPSFGARGGGGYGSSSSDTGSSYGATDSDTDTSSNEYTNNYAESDYNYQSQVIAVNGYSSSDYEVQTIDSDDNTKISGFVIESIEIK